ncbi:hypothetical protein E3P99_02828 [Wallemia hederae]|uniref:Tetraspanin Tsp2 n=1 Tax=Wallemia hederae TaxID=1540922 RepID=A0A4T0FIG6_9BASI|nr:hypothetical protein E3P99_02828 [Wallemia hederae]
MPSKTMFGIWALFDICLLVAGAVCVSVSTAWRSPDLLRDLVINDEEKRAGLALGILIILTVAYSTVAIVRRRAIYMKALNIAFILLTIVTIFIGAFARVLRPSAELKTQLRRSGYSRLSSTRSWGTSGSKSPSTTKSGYRTTHHSLTPPPGYQNTTSAGLFSQDAKQDFCTDLDNKSGCERKIVKFANDYINSVFSWVVKAAMKSSTHIPHSTIYGFVIILICLFLATVCVINERAKEDRFRRIDSKRSMGKMAD